jgi:hypothetical protein
MDVNMCMRKQRDIQRLMTRKQAVVFHISFQKHTKLNDFLLAHFQNEFLLGRKRNKGIFYRTIGMTQFDVDPVNISA